ncbi:MAG: beta-lactamase family protein [Saprospiraceae bacterium]|nr:beta-lactamase family protein [Saprospiraceae bacterium]
MKTNILLFAFLFTCNLILGQQRLNKNELDSLLDYYFAPYTDMDIFSGVVLIAKGNNIIIEKAYGYANFEFGILNEFQTKFRIASLSKPFTKLAIIQLSEQGKLSLNDKLSSYLPDYPNGDKIIIQQLMDHTSGIPHLNDFHNYNELAKEEYSIEELINLFKNKPLEFEPDTQEAYSNSGYILLTYIIEKVSGISYGEYLKENIFNPTGMKHSGHEESAMIIEVLANGYMMNLKGKGLQKPLYYNPSIKIGGASIYSTVEDLLLFNNAYKSGKLSRSTAPLYNEGIFGHSPGYNAMMWGKDDLFVTILSNNYNAPIQKIGFDIVKMVLGINYNALEKPKLFSLNKASLNDYIGDYKMENEIISIRKNGEALIKYENGDKWGACRLIPTSKDEFFDTSYLEKLIFIRNSSGNITQLIWQDGDEEI